MLPVSEILPDLLAHLALGTTAIVSAPPGAGKTTSVPLALLDQAWTKDGTILLLEPRRLAARAAATRMAEMLGEPVGRTVGYRVRGESRISAQTRIEVVTEGIFTRRVIDDPGLEGVACVIFDEFHERSLEADLGLAFARESQSLLRDDLRLVVMSATLDINRLQDLLPEAVSFHSQGRTFPIETHYLGRDQTMSLERDVARHAIRLSRRLSADHPDTLLIFLPGQGEIHRTARDLTEMGLPEDIRLDLLFGAMEFAEQKKVLAPLKAGERRVVLATAIAETSLTLDGVSMVLDCGQARLGRFDASRGVTRFVTERVSKASADQRRGRAGRTRPGTAFRLWDAEQDRSLLPHTPPEILETDLSQLALNLRLWGARSTQGLSLLDHPPAGAMTEAVALLKHLGALDAHGDITAHGRALSRLPLSPRIGHMVLKAAACGAAEAGARLAALLSENGLGGRTTDLETRLAALAHDKAPRAVQARALAQQWMKTASSVAESSPGAGPQMTAAHLLAETFPERVAQARGKPGEFVMANGRGAWLEAHDPLARAPWLAVGDLGGGAVRDRILLAAPLAVDDLLRLFSDRLEVSVELDPNARLKAVELTRLGALVLKSRRLDRVPAELLAAAETSAIRAKGIGALRIGEASHALRARVAFLRTQDETWPDLSDAALLGTLDDWLAPYAAGLAMTSLDEGTVHQALTGLLPAEQVRALDRLVPERLEAPTGSRLRIDYAADGGPRVEVRVQELYGLCRHPTVGPNRTPLTLALLSPAHRPIQITTDLPSFWDGSWSDVRKDMKGRYPRHVWPENPREADPTTRAKPRGT